MNIYDIKQALNDHAIVNTSELQPGRNLYQAPVDILFDLLRCGFDGARALL
jgi:hypothetical protein